MGFISDIFDPSVFIAQAKNEVYQKLRTIISGVTTGLSALGTWLSDTYEQAKADAITAFDAIDNAVGNLGVKIVGKLKDAMEFLRLQLADVSTHIVDTVTSGMTNVYTKLANATTTVTNIIDGLKADLSARITNVKNALTTVGNSIILDISNKITPISDNINALINMLTTPEKFGNILFKALEAGW